MSLIFCKECGKEISDKADKCPNCGCPVKKENNIEAELVQSKVKNNESVLKEKNRPKWSSGKLTIGIISEVLFFVIAFQSCAAGIYNSFSDNNELSGTTGIICALLIVVSGIISIVTKNSFKKTGSIICVVMYWLSSFFAYTESGTFSDLKVWGFIAFSFGVLHLLSIMDTLKTTIISSVCSLLFLIFASSIVGNSQPESVNVVNQNSDNENMQNDNDIEQNINNNENNKIEQNNQDINIDDSKDSFDFTTDDYNIKYTGYDIGVDYDGNDCVIIYYDFTNNSGDNASAMLNAYIKVFQDGVSCESAMLPFDLEVEEVSNHSKEIQSGHTISVADVFKISSDSDLTVEASEAFSFSDKKDTMILKIK